MRYGMNKIGDFWSSLNRRADNLREINEAERPSWIWGSHEPKSLEILKLYSWRIGIDPRQRSKILQNLLDW